VRRNADSNRTQAGANRAETWLKGGDTSSNRGVDSLARSHSRIEAGLDQGQIVRRQARLPPANEAIVAGGVGTKIIRQIAPRCPGPQVGTCAAVDRLA
jgi:hypothetical protein